MKHNECIVGRLTNMKPCGVNRQLLGDSAINVPIQCSFKHTEELEWAYALQGLVFLKMEGGRIGTFILLEPGSKGYLNIYGKTPFLICLGPVSCICRLFFILCAHSHCGKEVLSKINPVLLKKKQDKVL